MRPISAVVLVLFVAFFLIGCGGGSGSSGGPTPTPAPTPIATPTPVPSPSPTPTPSAVSVTVSPGALTLAAGGTQLFTATVSGSANTAVNWRVNGVAGGNALFGTIDSTGLYHSPTAPTAAPIAVTAVAQADINKSASAQVTITFSNASLTGDYVFLVNVGDSDPTQPALPGFAFAGGTFHADGNGNLSAGVEDQNSKTLGPLTNIAFTGTYSISSDGRGSATIATSTASTPFKFVLTSSDRGQLIEFDTLEAASGFVLRQDATAIANVTGPYVFSLFGDDAGGPIGIIGRLVSDGAGNLTGSEIVNDNGATSGSLALTGTYTVGAGGRGLATVTSAASVTQHFVFYIVNANTVQFVGIDNATLPRTAGTAFLQTGTGPLAASAFFIRGTFVSGGLFAAAGRFDTNGAGNITGGVYESFGVPVPQANGNPLGTYTLNADGSGQISVLNPGSGFNYWMISPTQAVLLVQGTIPTNQSAVGTGFIFAEQGGPLAAAQFKGNYAFGLSLDVGLGATGQIKSDGVSTFTGNEDVTRPAAAVLSADLSLSANWTLELNGRGSAGLTAGGGNPVGLVFHPISANEIIFATSDGAIGLAEKQCSDCH